MRCSSCGISRPFWPMVRKFPDRATATCPNCGTLSRWVPRIRAMFYVSLAVPATQIEPKALSFFCISLTAIVMSLFDDVIDRKLAPAEKTRPEALDYRSRIERDADTTNTEGVRSA